MLIGSNCPSCPNGFSKKVVRATGDWTVDAGSQNLWLASEPLGLMTFDEGECNYNLVIKGINASTNYKWKVTIDNSFAENYGNYDFFCLK